MYTMEGLFVDNFSISIINHELVNIQFSVRSWKTVDFVGFYRAYLMINFYVILLKIIKEILLGQQSLLPLLEHEIKKGIINPH